MEEKNIVYGDTPEGLILIPEKRAIELAEYYEILNTAVTWGELRTTLPTDVFENVMRISDQYDGPWKAEDGDLSPFYIPDDTEYTESDIMAFQESGINPGFPEIEMTQWVPLEIQEKFGRRKRYYSMDGSAPKGEILELDEDKLPDILQALEEQGFHCKKNNQLTNNACGYF